MAKKMSELLAQVRPYEGSGDPQLDIVLGLATSSIYNNFGKFLERVAKANPQVAPILNQKAMESYQSAQKSRSECRRIILSANLVSPTNSACQTGSLPTMEQALRWPTLVTTRKIDEDPQDAGVIDLQKKLFLQRTDWKLYFDLAESYLNKGLYHHASAASLYGMANFNQNQEEFKALLGCAVLKLGLITEGQFLLNKASELNGHKQQCLSEIKNKMGFR